MTNKTAPQLLLDYDQQTEALDKKLRYKLFLLVGIYVPMVLILPNFVSGPSARSFAAMALPLLALVAGYKIWDRISANHTLQRNKLRQELEDKLKWIRKEQHESRRNLHPRRTQTHGLQDARGI